MSSVAPPAPPLASTRPPTSGDGAASADAGVDSDSADTQQPQAQVIEGTMGEVLTLPSLCMECFKNVRGRLAGEAARLWGGRRRDAPAALRKGLVDHPRHELSLFTPQNNTQGETRMLMTKIPHFREVMVCSFECPHCGNRCVCVCPLCVCLCVRVRLPRPPLRACLGAAHRLSRPPPPPHPRPTCTTNNSNNEVSFTGAFGERGTRTSLTVPAAAPPSPLLSRQVVKADTAAASIPELEFEIPAGTQKGCITTVEGLLREAGDKLRALQPERRAANPDGAAAIDAFLVRLDEAVAGQTEFTLVLDDPAGNSGVEAAGPGDPLVRVEYYDRTPEQAAACGLKPQVRV